MVIERIKVEGISDSEDRLEFIDAVDYWQGSGKDIVNVIESYKGTVEAFADILKNSNSRKIIEDLVDIFYKYGCKFKASWIMDDINSDYKATINLSRIPVGVSKEIIKLSKRIDKAVKKEKIAQQKKRMKSFKERAKKQKEESKMIIDNLRKYKR